MVAPRIFLSYSRADSIFSTRLRKDLMDRGIFVWRDLEDIDKAEGWDSEIEVAICSPKTTHLVLIESQASCRHESVCRDEIEYAINCRKRILRTLRDKTHSPPLRVIRKTWIDFSDDEKYSSSLDALVTEINRHTAPSSSKLNLVGPSISFNPPTGRQVEAAEDNARYVRLIAGPGTGKSHAIAHRVQWLIRGGVEPRQIQVVSFTRSASSELRSLIQQSAQQSGLDATDVTVGTLHSLAFAVLRRTGKLRQYPTRPRVLDRKWEIPKLFDAEFREFLRQKGLDISDSRTEKIRLAVEAHWNTGEWLPPEDMLPEQPISDVEIRHFNEFLISSRLLYGYVLPGELVQQCTEAIQKNLIPNPAQVLGTTQLIVDEFQDMNFMDTQFVKAFADGGSTLFVAGDDDQSIYAFRHAYPSGIRDFGDAFPGTSDHVLDECFRSAPEVLRVAQGLIDHYPSPKRIDKVLASSPRLSEAGVMGVSRRWKFRSATSEARAIALSCDALISAGMAPTDITILVRQRRFMVKPLEDALKEFGVPYRIDMGKSYKDYAPGRFLYALLRVICDENLEDFVAHRTVLGLLPGVGIRTCFSIRQKTIEANIGLMSLFYGHELNLGLSLNRQENRAVQAARHIFEEVMSWGKDDTLGSRLDDIIKILAEARLTSNDVVICRDRLAKLPEQASLEHVLQYVAAENDIEEELALKGIYEALKMELTSDNSPPAQVSIRTMHSMKGLSTHIVFIPGLEEGFLPDQESSAIPGLILEQARLLYVSITRARTATILSFAASRQVNGANPVPRFPSRFVENLGGAFTDEPLSLSSDEVTEIMASASNFELVFEEPM